MVVAVSGSALSPTAALGAIVPPFIIDQPKSRQVNVGETVTFTVEAGGTLPLSYQWLRNGVRIPNATERSYTIQGVLPSDGASYRVVVANAGGAVRSDSAFLRVNVPVRELADHFRDRELLREPAGVFRSTNRGATVERGEPRHAGKFGGKSVWFAWAADVPGILTVRTRGSHFDTLLAAYTGEEVGALTEIASDEDRGGFLNSEIAFNVTGKKPYAIAIDGFNGYEGELLVEWSFEPTDEKLPILLEQPTEQVVKLGSDVRFSARVEQPNVMYQWFFNGAPISEAVEPVLLLRDVRVGQAGLYYVMITDGRRTTLSRAVTLQFNAIGPDNLVQPFFARDKFGDVVRRDQFFGVVARSLAVEEPGVTAMAAGGGVVHGYTGTQLFSTVGAVKDEDEPDHCGIPGGASYWYAYVPPSSGQMFMNTDGSSFDTVLAIYTATGPTYADLIPVACDNNSGSNRLTSRVSFPVQAGETYYVVVDGVNGASGNVRLSYKLLVPLVLSDAVRTNSFRFRITATPFVPFTIQHSADLEEWLPLITTNTATGFYEHLDTNNVVIRFYRALQSP